MLQVGEQKCSKSGSQGKGNRTELRHPKRTTVSPLGVSDLQDAPKTLTSI